MGILLHQKCKKLADELHVVTSDTGNSLGGRPHSATTVIKKYSHQPQWLEKTTFTFWQVCIQLGLVKFVSCFILIVSRLMCIMSSFASPLAC